MYSVITDTVFRRNGYRDRGLFFLWAAGGSGCCKRAYDAPLTFALFAHVELAENGVIHHLPWRAPRSTGDTREKINDRLLIVHTPPTLETLRERISLSTRSCMEIAGLLKKKKKKRKNNMMMMITRNS